MAASNPQVWISEIRRHAIQRLMNSGSWFGRWPFVWMAVLLFANIFLLAGAAHADISTTSPNQIGYYCSPYTATYVEGGFYNADGTSCTYTIGTLPGGTHYGDFYRGTVGSSTVINGHSLGSFVQSIQPNDTILNPVQGESLFTAIYSVIDNSSNITDFRNFFTHGTPAPNQNYGFINWKYGIQPVDATVTAPVIIIPGILGSAPHNGEWIIDPITHAYDNLIDTLIVNGYEKDLNLFPFPYDWHKSNIDTAVLLKSKIDAVKTICQCDKVDIVAHSMGGLVARQYIQSGFYEHDVRKLIFLGTPQQGAPEDYLMWEGGQSDVDSDGQKLSIFLKIEARGHGYSNLFDYIHTVPITSVQELLPVYGYIKHVGSSDISPFPNSEWYPNNPFLYSLNGGISNLYNSGVTISNFVGQASEDKTITTVRVVPPFIVNPAAVWGFGIPEGLGDSSTDQGLERGVGDDTVPLSSASFVPNDLQIFNSEHNSLPTKAEGAVFNKLTGKNAAVLINNNHGFFETLKNVLVFQILSPADIVVTDPNGNKVGKDFSTGQEINQIPGAFYSGFGTDEEFVTIPSPMDGQYKVTTQGTGSGGTYTIATGVVGDATSSETFFTGQTQPNQIIEQNVQVDTSNPSGTVITPADTTPPTITITQPATSTFVHGSLMPVKVTFADTTGVATSSVTFNGRQIAASTTVDLFFELAGSNPLVASTQDFVNNTASTTRIIQVTATFTSTQNDINRMYVLKWVTKDAKSLLTKDLSRASSARKIADKIKYLQTMQTDLNNLKAIGKVNLQGYQILTADINWLIYH